MVLRGQDSDKICSVGEAASKAKCAQRTLSNGAGHNDFVYCISASSWEQRLPPKKASRCVCGSAQPVAET